MATPIRIKVGCSLESGWDKPFSSIEKRARQAGTRVKRDLGGGRGGSRVSKQVADEAVQMARKRTEAEKRVTQNTKTEAQKRVEAIRKEARQRAREHKRLVDEVNRDERRASRQREREAAAAARRKAQAERHHAREVDRFARRTSHRATRFLAPNAPVLSMARRTAMDLAHGAGIETNLGGAFGRGIELESRATQLVEAAYQPGAGGSSGVRQDPTQILNEVRQVGDDLAMPYQDALGALEAFVTKTGDLQTGRAMLADMAKLAAATGTNLTDMVDAAGDVSNALGDIPNKAKAIDLVMRQFVVQGKVGAVEIKDLAKYMAILSASAGQFGGNAEDTIVKLGALAQLSRAKGGAASAAQATRSVAGLANTLQTPARRAKFEKFGVQLENEQGLLRDPIEILKESIRKTGGDTEKVKQMWANVIGAKPANAMSAAYKQAGGGAAGDQAMEALLKPYLGSGAMSTKQRDQAVESYLATDKAAVQRFNNEIEKVANQIRADLAPTVAELAPKILDLVRAFGDLVGWMARNPGLAIVTAITASIARAGIESAFRAAIERAIKGAADRVDLPNGGSAAAGGGAGLSGKPSAVQVVNAAAIGAAVGAAVYGAIYQMGTSEVDKREADTDWIMKQAKLGNAAEGKKAAEERLRQIEAEDAQVLGLSAPQGALANWVTGGKAGEWSQKALGWMDPFKPQRTMEKASMEQAIADADARLAPQLDKLSQQMGQVEQTLRSGIRVTNLDEVNREGPPEVDGKGRGKQ